MVADVMRVSREEILNERARLRSLVLERNLLIGNPEEFASRGVDELLEMIDGDHLRSWAAAAVLLSDNSRFSLDLLAENPAGRGYSMSHADGSELFYGVCDSSKEVASLYALTDFVDTPSFKELSNPNIIDIGEALTVVAFKNYWSQVESIIMEAQATPWHIRYNVMSFIMSRPSDCEVAKYAASVMEDELLPSAQADKLSSFTLACLHPHLSPTTLNFLNTHEPEIMSMIRAASSPDPLVAFEALTASQAVKLLGNSDMMRLFCYYKLEAIPQLSLEMMTHPDLELYPHEVSGLILKNYQDDISGLVRRLEEAPASVKLPREIFSVFHNYIPDTAQFREVIKAALALAYRHRGTGAEAYPTIVYLTMDYYGSLLRNDDDFVKTIHWASILEHHLLGPILRMLDRDPQALEIYSAICGTFEGTVAELVDVCRLV